MIARHVSTRHELAALLLAAALARPASSQCEIDQLNGTSGLKDDTFGWGVSISVDVAAIGDPVAQVVYVFRRQGFEWQPEGELTPAEPGHAGPDYFGFDVAASGDVIAVGAMERDAPEYDSGAVDVFRFNGAQWLYETTLTASDGDAQDVFGRRVSLDGQVLLVGASFDENDGDGHFGSAYVFRYNGRSWIEEQKLAGPTGLGGATALKGDVALLGAPGNSDARYIAGAAFVYRYDGTAWSLEQGLYAEDAQENDWFGTGVALSGDPRTAVIGAPQENGQTGAVYVFRYDGSRWYQEAKLTAAQPSGPFPFFGVSVSISPAGDSLLAGAPFDFARGFESGAAHLFHRNGTRWFEVLKITASVTGPSSCFGGELSLAGDAGLISATGDGISGTVSAYVGLSARDCNGNSEADACEIFGGTADDLNGNGVLDECEAVGDLDGDGMTDVEDLIVLILHWGPCAGPCPPACGGDVDGDCQVGLADLIVLIANWT